MPTLFSPEQAAETIRQVIAESGALGYIRLMAIGIIALLFLLNLYQALMTGSGRSVFEALLRAAIAGTLVQNSSVFAGGAVAFFQALDGIGQLIQSRLGDWASVAEVDALIREVADALLANLGAQGGWLEALANLGNYLLFALSASLTTLLMVVFFVIMMAIFNFLVFMALVTLTIATLVAPLSFAAVASRWTQPFAFEWLQVILHAALVIMLAQALVGIVVNTAVLQPLREFAEAVRTGATAVGGAVRVPVAALMAMLIGIFAMLGVQRIAASFVGKVEAVGAGIMAVYAATRLGGAAAAAGGRVGGSAATASPPVVPTAGGAGTLAARPGAPPYRPP